MQFVDERYEENFYTSGLFDLYFGGARPAVFDIETTGLSPASAKLILGGLLTPCAGGVRIRQFLSDGGHEEPELLGMYMDALSEADVLFSYNGDSFDRPFLTERLKRRHRGKGFHRHMSVDMYRVVRSHSNLGAVLPNLKQKTLENYMGLWRFRSDRASGADSARLYHEYVAAKSPGLLNLILLHNSDDLRQLSRILSVFDRLDIHKAVFRTGFPVRSGDVLAFIDSISLRRGELECVGRCEQPTGIELFDEAFRASFDSGASSFVIRIPCVSEKNLLLADAAALGLADSALSDEAAFRSGYLILKQGDNLNYGAVNHLAKLVTECVISRFSR